MDEWKPGMDDEATPDPDGAPYVEDADDGPSEAEDAQDIGAFYRACLLYTSPSPRD